MALKIGPIDGHTVMLDAQNDPECIWIMCSCGAVLNVNSPPSGESLKESLYRISDHLGKEPPDEEALQQGMEMFDSIFQPEEEG